MAILNTAVFVAELGNGVKTLFEFSFKVFATTDLAIYKETSAGVYTPQTIVGDWGADPDPLPAANTCFVTFDTEAETGTVTYSEAPATGLVSVIARNTPETQGTSFPAVAVWSKKIVENALDKLTMIAQEVDEKLERAALQPLLPVNPDPVVISLPVDGKGLKWRAGGDGKFYLDSTTEDAEDMVEAAAASASAALISQNAAAASAAAALVLQNAAAVSASAAAASAVAAAASAVVANEILSGLYEDRPLAPAANIWYYSTDREQLERYAVIAGKWFLIG